MNKIAKIGFLLLMIYSCSDDGPGGNNAPVLTYLGLFNDTMRQGIGQDTVVVVLAFEDTDGDILGGNVMNISLIDNRDGTVEPLSFPVLPELKQGQRGQFQMVILSTCCIFPPDQNIPACESDPSFPPNQYTYDIYIEDGAGNRSNTVTTDVITLLCN